MTQYTPPGQMHPQDMRNMLYFAVVAIAAFLLFDRYFMQPKIQQTQLAQMAVAGQAAQKAPAPEAILPIADVLSDATRLTIDTPQLAGTLALKGGRLDDVVLKNYKIAEGSDEGMRLLAPAQTENPAYFESGWVGQSDGLILPDKNTVWSLAKGSGETLTSGADVTLVWTNPQNITFTRAYSVDDAFMITLRQSVTNGSGAAIQIAPYTAVAQRGMSVRDEGGGIAHVGPVVYADGELEETAYGKMAKNPSQQFTATSGWAGLTDKYWLVAALPDQVAAKTFRMMYSEPTAPGTRPLYQVDVTPAVSSVAPGEMSQVVTHLFVGAKQASLLQEYQTKLGVANFELAVDFGILFFLTKPFYWLLSQFFHLVGNFGVAILMLTLLIRLAIYPLASTSFRAFAKLKTVAPHMQEIRTKYVDDKARMQQEIVKLYEREKVNPMAGCLPILIQIPIFFAMYKVIYITIEMRHAPFFGWITDLSVKDPTTIFNLFGLVPFTPPSWLPVIGIWPCLMLIFMLIQQKLNPPPTDNMQRIMFLYMPFLMTFILSGFPAGLVVYWTFSNALSVLQQAYIMRSMGVPIHLFGETDEAKAKKAHKASLRDLRDEPRVTKKVKRKDAGSENLFGADDSQK
ncbi:MAG: membrane protein insertase YidC [Pseudomonadota bacterium]